MPLSHLLSADFSVDPDQTIHDSKTLTDGLIVSMATSKPTAQEL